MSADSNKHWHDLNKFLQVFLAIPTRRAMAWLLLGLETFMHISTYLSHNHIRISHWLFKN